MGAIGPILIILIVGAVYWYFSHYEQKEHEHATDMHVKRTMADAEIKKLEMQAEELKLKREYFEYEKAKLGHDSSNINATYEVREKLEDKSNK